MRHIYQISNESSPGVSEPWYEVYLTEKSRMDAINRSQPVAHLSTKDELDIYTKGCGMYQLHSMPKLSGEYIVNNDTDGFPASPDIFKSRKSAEEWIARFRARFKELNANEEFPDGFYKTSSCEYIHPKDIKLTIEEV